MLLSKTDPLWLNAVINDFDSFLLDHAANEKKASAMALTFVAHYRDKPEFISAMIDLAIEELNHYKEVMQIILNKNLTIANDSKDPYVTAVLKLIRKGSETYFLDRLLTAAIIEARGEERFTMIAQTLDPGPMKKFYTAISRSEQRHHQLFVHHAKRYYPEPQVQQRLQQLLQEEAAIVAGLPYRAALH